MLREELLFTRYDIMQSKVKGDPGIMRCVVVTIDIVHLVGRGIDIGEPVKHTCTG